MSDIDWTAVIVAFIGGGGTLTAAIGIWAQRRRTHTDKAAEDRAAEVTRTPAHSGTGVHDVEAIRLAQQAMQQVTSLSDKLCQTETRLDDVERELGFLRRSYRQLYWWAQRLLMEWESHRENPDPPPLPDDIYHPDS